MFSLVSQQQALLPFSSLASILNVRAAASRSSSRNHHQTQKWQQKNDFSQADKDRITNYIHGLGVSELEVNRLTDAFLSCVNKNKEKSSWHESHSSTDSFFRNKNGFDQQLLQNPIPNFMSASVFSVFQNVLKQAKAHNEIESVRGFRTRKPTGVGLPKEESGSKSLKTSIFDRSDQKSKHSDKLKQMISDFENQPEVREKLLLAFAEGYNVHDKKAEKTTMYSKFMRFILYGVILWSLFQLFQLFSPVGGTGMRGLGVLNREHYEINPEDIEVTFDDVKGVDEAKQELKDIVEFLRDPEKFTNIGAKLPRGVLLVGPPGIGKTLLARAVAGEAGVPFFHASGSEFDEIFVGTGAKRVRQLFSAAKLRSPCVVFIDEIDTVGAKRTSSQIHPYANQTINQLLSEMDGFQQNEGVIVLGATNRRDNLDKALLRPGRFDVEIRVYAPDLKGRQEILEHYLSKIKVDTDVDIEATARGTTGFTGADLENLVNQAALKAAIDQCDLVTKSHMEFARDKVLMGPAKKSRIPDEETNWLTAYHEAGHTIVAAYTKDAIALHKVTIIPRGMSLGHTSFVPDKEEYGKTKSQLLAQMDVAMGGRVAEEMIYGSDKVTTGAGSDFGQATAIATAMVKRFGMSEKVGCRVFDEDAIDSGLSMLKVNEVGPALTELVDGEIKRFLQESYERARNIIKTHAVEHKALAIALMEHETLDKDEIQTILKGKRLEKEPKNPL